MPRWTDFDSNGDGRLSESEFLQGRAQRIAERSQQGYAMRGLANAPDFATLDRNGDGYLDQAEFGAVQSHHMRPPLPMR